MPEKAPDILRRRGQQVDAALRRWMARWSDAPVRLLEAVEYSALGPGKRLRPTLVLETAAACGKPDTPTALAAATAIELVHTFSLVHDDLPAMDDDDLRRGRPTNHRVFGEAMAILAGDAMLAMAFELIAAEAEPSLAGPLVLELARATGPAGMIGGQVLDMESQNRRLDAESLRDLHRRKTGALLTAACRMGAMSAGADAATLEAVGGFGRSLGIAFQIVDDLLDVTASAEQLGKAAGKDAARGKNTYPTVLGLDASRAEAQRHLSEGLSRLTMFDSRADGLRVLARFVVERNK